MMSLFLLVNVITCNEEILILEDNNTLYNIDFFNLIFYSDDYKLEACQYLIQSDEIVLEKEPLAQNSYYIYADNQLFQEIAIHSKWAKINLNYPEYLHIIEKDKTVMNINEFSINTNNHSFLVLIILTFIFLINLCVFILVSKM